MCLIHTLAAVYVHIVHLYITVCVLHTVFIADTGKEVFVWIGSGASPAENKNALPYAHVSYIHNNMLLLLAHSLSLIDSTAVVLLQNYLMRTKHPLVPVTCIKDGKETSAFNAIFN